MDSIGKRMYRNLGDDTKAKISQSLRGRSNSSCVPAHLFDGPWLRPVHSTECASGQSKASQLCEQIK